MAITPERPSDDHAAPQVWLSSVLLFSLDSKRAITSQELTTLITELDNTPGIDSPSAEIDTEDPEEEGFILVNLTVEGADRETAIRKTAVELAGSLLTADMADNLMLTQASIQPAHHGSTHLVTEQAAEVYQAAYDSLVDFQSPN